MKYKKNIILGVVLLAVFLIIITLSNSTYALFSNDAYGENTNNFSTGMLSIEAHSKSENISLSNVLPISDSEGLASEPYVFTIKNYGNLDYLFDVKLLSTGDSSTTFSPQYIKMQIDNGDIVTLSSLTNGEIKSDVTLLAGESIDVTIRLWLDIETPNSELGKSFTSKIVIDGQAVYTSSNKKLVKRLSNHIIDLYKNGNNNLITQDVSNDSYYYSWQDTEQTWGLMNDGLKVDNTLDATITGLATEVTDVNALTSGSEGNIRYFGPSNSVNNYIYFNCSDYSNQSDSTCEKWRIIGIVDGKVKIIRDESIGNLAWDQDKNQDSSLTTYSNNWETSSLQEFLNGLYYNRGSTDEYTYYSGSDGTTSTTLYLSDIGITEATRNNNLISNSTWYLGSYSSSYGLYPNDIYNYERQNIVGTTIYGTNDFTINNSIGLMYPSDYAYATNLTKCSKDIYNYDFSACNAYNWLVDGNLQWLITPALSINAYAWNVYPAGLVRATWKYVYQDTLGVRPVLYLNSDVLIKNDGDGSRTNPYQINISN